MRVAAVIPIGSLEGAKTRLAGMIDAEERHDLVVGLLARTVDAALAADRLDDVLVISPDRDVLALATERGARTLRQRSRGLNAGVRDGRDDVAAGGADAVLVIPMDLPLISPEAIDAVVTPLTEGAGPAVVLVPDRHGTGTNTLGLRPPDVIDVAFGPSSRHAHRTRAEAAGVPYIEPADSPLSVDLDTPEDLVFIETTAPERIGVG